MKPTGGVFAFTLVIVALAAWDVPALAGDGATQITFHPAQDWNPSWSPDGTQIAFSSDRVWLDDVATGSANGVHIWVAPTAGGTATQLTFGPAYDFAPAWSPDGSRIAFGRDLADVWVVPATGGAETQITQSVPISGGFRNPTWSPDCSQIAFEANNLGECLSDDYRLAVVATAGGQITPLTPECQFDRAPSWSPVSSLIAFSHFQRFGTQGIYTFSADSSVTGVHVTTDQTDSDPTWSPDGSQIAFHSMRSGNWDIWVVGAGGGIPRQLTTDPAVDRYPSWSAHGSLIAFSSDRSGNQDVWTISATEPVSVSAGSWGSIKGKYRK